MSLYDDNFGIYEAGDDPAGTREFYDRVQKESVWKKCDDCGRRVKLRPSYGICNACADRRERTGGY
jgi:hypothetical protein